jgi:NodT family efflux transporter outer membrane factor (OMF) lipoprotein
MVRIPSLPAHALALAAALALAGCATAPQAPATPPGLSERALEHFAQADASAQLFAPDEARLAQWWRHFDDAGLDTLMQQALDGNRSLRAAQATVREAQAARAAAEAGTRPQIGTSATATRSATRSSAANNFQLGFSASWEPDFSGAQSAGVQAADADLQASQADLATTRMSLAAEVGLAYVQWRGAQARQHITQASLASLEQTLALAKVKAQVGLASALDLEQARLAVEQTRASLPSLATEVAQYEHQLALLSGRTPAELQRDLPPPAAARPVPRAPDAIKHLAVGLPSDLLRRRPDLRSAEAAVRAAWLRQEQTRRAGWPGVNLTGSVGLQALTLTGLAGTGAGLAALAAGVDWTVFDAGLRAAQVEQQGAALERSRATYEAAVLGAVKDVDDSLAALRGSRDRMVALGHAADAAAATLRWTRVRHESGLTDFDHLLEAQRNELSALLALQTTQADVSLNLIRVYKALGGGWAEDTTASNNTP